MPFVWRVLFTRENAVTSRDLLARRQRSLAWLLEALACGVAFFASIHMSEWRADRERAKVYILSLPLCSPVRYRERVSKKGIHVFM